MKKAFIELHIAVLLAGFTGVLGRLITMNEGLLVWYRLLITAVTLWVLMIATKKIQPLPLKDILKISAIGFISALHWVAFYAAIKYANVSVGLVCLSAVGFFSSILEPLLNRARINIIELLFGLLSIVGIYLIFHFDTRYELGIILGVIAAFFSSLFPILLKMSMKRINMHTVLTWQITGGFVSLSLIMPLYLYFFPVKTIIPSMNDFLWLLVLAWLCSVVAFQFSMSALKKLSAFTVSLSYNMEPLYGIIMAFVIFKENKILSAGFYAGLAVIGITLISHMFLLRYYHRKQMKTEVIHV